MKNFQSTDLKLGYTQIETEYYQNIQIEKSNFKSKIIIGTIQKKFYFLLMAFFLFSLNNQAVTFTGYGNGLTIPVISSGTIDDIRARVVSATLNSNSITIDNIQGGGFTQGQVVLIIEMESCTIGKNWEFNIISSVSNSANTSTLGLTYNLQYAYSIAQVIMVPQYHNLIVTGTITCSQYNPTLGSGGVIAILDNGTLNITNGGAIDASKKGFANIPNDATQGVGGTGGHTGGLGASVAGTSAGDGNGELATGEGSGNGASSGAAPDNTIHLAGINNCCDCSIGHTRDAFNASFYNSTKQFNLGGAGQSGNGGLGKAGAGGAGAGCVTGYPGGDGFSGATAGDGGDGGNGARGGGIILIKAKGFINNGMIKSEGENAQPQAEQGINGVNGGNAAVGSGAGGGYGGLGGEGGWGGSGGAGGLIYIISTTLITYNPVTMSLIGGDLGLGGTDGTAGSSGYTDLATCTSICPLKPRTFICECPQIWNWINSSPAPSFDLSGHIWTFVVNPSVTCIATTTPGQLDISCKEDFCPGNMPKQYNTYKCSMEQVSNNNNYAEDVDLLRYTLNPQIKQTYYDPVAPQCHYIINYSNDAQTNIIDYYKDHCCPIEITINKDGLPGDPGKFGSDTETVMLPPVVIPHGPVELCINEQQRFEITGDYDGYNWSPTTGLDNHTNNIVIASPDVSTTYTVTVTAINGSTATTTVAVIVNPNPNPPTVSAFGSTTICENGSSSVLLNATVIGSGLTYTWNDFSGTNTEDLTVYGNDPSFTAFNNPYLFNLTVTDVNGCSSVSNSILVNAIPCNPNVNLNLNLFLQGFYDLNTHLMVACLNLIDPTSNPDPTDVDDLTITAMDPSTFLPVESHVGRLKTNGNLSVSFTGPAIAGNAYYIKITHRNAVETWSKNPVLFSSSVNYDFTASSTQAYDDGFNLPMKLIDTNPVRWAIYNGDVNQDGAIDAQDMTFEENDSNAGAFGYNATDLNGDGGSDALDMTIIENNGNAGVFTAHP